MTTIVKSVVGALLAVLGLVLTVIGAWFATQLGSSGTAQFTARPATTDPVILRPSVLNRVDSDVVVTATPAEGATVWMALANPSDAADVLGDARVVSATGVGVRDWVLLTRTVGSGEAPTLGLADLWRQQDSAQGPVTLTVKQEQAPEALVIATEGGPLETVTFTVTNKTWFVESVVAVLAGLFLIVAGVALAWPSRRSGGNEPAEEQAEQAHAEQASAEDAPAEEAPTEDAMTDEAPPEDAPTEQAPADEAPVEGAPTEEAPTEEVAR